MNAMHPSKEAMMPKRLLVACCLALSVLAAWPVRAEEAPPASGGEPVIFQMADGLFFNPATGFSAVSREGLIALIQDGVPAAPSADAAPPSPPPEVPAVPAAHGFKL